MAAALLLVGGKVKKVIFFVITAALVGVDQLIKFVLAQVLPKEFDSMVIIDGVLNFTHVENEGAAFSVLSGKTWFLIILTLIIIIFGIYLILSNKITTPIMKTSFCLMISGGLGNLIDRIFRDGCVFDFIDLDFAPLKNFAIFNFADCLVVVGVIVMIVGLFVEDVFHDKGKPNA